MGLDKLVTFIVLSSQNLHGLLGRQAQGGVCRLIYPFLDKAAVWTLLKRVGFLCTPFLKELEYKTL